MSLLENAAVEECSSPRVLRCILPSPLRCTPSPSKEKLMSFYSSPVPKFMLDAMETVSATGKEDAVDLPRDYLPDFSFRMLNGFPNPTTADFKRVVALFPGCLSVAYSPPFLVILWRSLPTKPWPLTLGHVPLFYGTPEKSRAPTYGRAGGSEAIFTDSDDSLLPWVDPKGRTKAVLQHLVEVLGVCIHYFGWSGTHWYAEVLSRNDGQKLPQTICGLIVMWRVHFEQEATESSRRGIIPSSGTVPDTTSYKPELRPGIMLASEGGRGTTSGIPLVGPEGNRYITVARHGFPEGDEIVYHPTVAPMNRIGQVKLAFMDADIALVELKDGIQYSTTSFDSAEQNGTILLGLQHSEFLCYGEYLYLDSAFNGKCAGIVISKGLYVIPHDSPHGQYDYTVLNMLYFGNGAKDIFPGTCGTCFWTRGRMVAGTFRWYHDEDAIAFSSAVDVLIEHRYRLEQIM